MDKKVVNIYREQSNGWTQDMDFFWQWYVATALKEEVVKP